MDFTDAQWAKVREISGETGVCDWSRPGVGEVERSLTWLSYGNDREVPAEPRPIPNPGCPDGWGQRLTSCWRLVTPSLR